jgi:uncharacterized protein (DUF486 family)
MDTLRTFGQLRVTVEVIIMVIFEVFGVFYMDAPCFILKDGHREL